MPAALFHNPKRPSRVSVAQLECLEGRRLLAARAAAIRIVEVEANGAVELQITGTSRADTLKISDTGTDAAGNITLTYGNGKTYKSKKAVDSVLFLGGRGRDHVVYDLASDLSAARTVNINLGQGDDRFDASVTGAIIATNASLNLQAYGNQGNDTLTYNQTGATRAGIVFPFLSGDVGNDTITYTNTGNIDTAGKVGPALVGGGGNDVLSANQAGVISGTYMHNLTLVGGIGNDTLNQVVAVKAGSKGKLGESATLPGQVDGGVGNDQITYSVLVDSTVTGMPINTKVTGGAGSDRVQRTPNVTGDSSNETDILLS